MKKILVFIIFLFFISCKKKKPELFITPIDVRDFEVKLKIEAKNVDFVDHFEIKRKDLNSNLPFVFNLKGGESVIFHDTLVTPDYGFTYDVKAFYGSDFISNSIYIKTKSTSDYLLLFSPLFLRVDKSFSVDVKIFNVSDLFGISFRIVLDNNYLSIDSLKKGNLWDSDDLFFFRVSNDSDTIYVAVTKQRGDTPISGKGEILKIYFTPKIKGNTEVKLNDLWIYDDNGIKLINPSALLCKIEIN